ncbi:MAG TPA: YbjN domain-containing protein [Micropepsaceae bacterium]|nr:YbjN domain-containing protein [Micropepsaceae bacterium]
MRKSWLLTAALAATVGFGAATLEVARAADVITEVTAQQMGNILKQNGFEVTEVGVTSDGKPQVTAKHNNTVFQVLFYGCNNANPVRCMRIQLRADYNSPQIQLDPLNNYNASWVFGKAYRYQSDGGYGASIEIPVNLEGGVTAANLTSTFDIWRDVLQKFEAEALGFTNSTPR